MKYISLIVSVLIFSSFAFSGNHGPCKIERITQSDSYSKFLIVRMSCNGTDLPSSCNNVSQNEVTYDATAEMGNVRTSLLLSAFAAQKSVRISSWGACPTEVSNVPLVYSIIVE